MEAAKAILSDFKHQQKIIRTGLDNESSLQVLIKKENVVETDELVSDLRDNDRKILLLLQQENDDCKNPQYTFNGLLRKLDMHQQSLARSLQRLQKLGLIGKLDNGYKLIAKNIESSLLCTLHDQDNLHKTKTANKQGKQHFQLLQTRIPFAISDEEIVQGLVGKWFNNLRWIGLMENEGGYWLQWINSDNSFSVSLYLVSKYIMIETNAISDSDKIEAMAGSYRVYEQIVRVLRQKLGSLDICTLDCNYDHLHHQDN